MNLVDISISALLLLKFIFLDDFDFLQLFFIIFSSVSGKYIVLLLNNLIFVQALYFPNFLLSFLNNRVIERILSIGKEDFCNEYFSLFTLIIIFVFITNGFLF
jgi:hypothetical protein